MRLGEFLSELRLPGQNDLQQFGVASLEVGKQANGFQHGIVEVLRFIDDQHKAPAGQHFRKQYFVQLAVHSDEPHGRRINAQVGEKVLEKFAGVALRLEEKRGSRGVAKSLKNLIHEGGFAQAGL